VVEGWVGMVVVVHVWTRERGPNGDR
jgi:hypothetical protein